MRNKIPSHAPKTLARLLSLLVPLLIACGSTVRPASPSTEAALPTPEIPETSDDFEPLEVPITEDPVATFVLDGKPFCFTGTNNYYLHYNSRRMVDDVMSRAVQMGLEVFRVWGFIDRGSLDESVPSVDDKWEEKGTKNGHYIQYWDKENNRVGINDGENGLQKLDYVLHAARLKNLKLIVVLTNGWQDFGGMDQYIKWFGKKYHHEFYTDDTIKAAFKNYISTLVNRTNSIDGVLYRDDPALFAWELANEPKCRNFEEFDATNGWDTKTIVHWADEISRHIKSIDPNHLVAVGDEGWLDSGAGQGTDGVDHEALCAVDSIDFCTFHLYPDDWGTGIKFGYDWIRQHIDIARKLGKPTILEEYNTQVRRDETNMSVVWGFERRKAALVNWTTLMQNLGGNGMLFWMLSGADDTHGMYPDYDHYGVYQGEPTGDLIQQLATDFKVNASACRLSEAFLENAPKSEFVSVANPPAGKQDR